MWIRGTAMIDCEDIVERFRGDLICLAAKPELEHQTLVPVAAALRPDPKGATD
jgi:hypothetical protein